MAEASKKREGKVVDEDDVTRIRPFWSGVITFGLVNLAVGLFPASRGKAFALKMVDADGTVLRRRYYCERENKILERDELVRGYEVDDGKFVIIEEDELAAAAPEKSREIDLRRFVPLETLDPVYFERAYFLTPNSEVTKPYRLLAKSMEQEKRAGIATFVMRDREHLVAIMAEGGILRAEILRFSDELRSPDYIGLPERQAPAQTSVARMKKALKTCARDRLEPGELRDRETEQLVEFVERKHRSGRNVITLDEERAAEVETQGNVVDMMQVLKQRLQGRRAGGSAERDESGSGQRKGRASGSNETDRDKPLREMSKKELYERAQAEDLPGRSGMSKNELIDALAD